MLPFAADFPLPSPEQMLCVALVIVGGTLLLAFALALIVALIVRRPRLRVDRPTVCLDDSVRRLWPQRTASEPAGDHRQVG